MAEKLLTPREAAEILGITESTIGSWRRQGYGPTYIKMGGMFRYRLRSVQAFLIVSTYKLDLRNSVLDRGHRSQNEPIYSRSSSRGTPFEYDIGFCSYELEGRN